MHLTEVAMLCLIVHERLLLCGSCGTACWSGQDGYETAVPAVSCEALQVSDALARQPCLKCTIVAVSSQTVLCSAVCQVGQELEEDLNEAYSTWEFWTAECSFATLSQVSAASCCCCKLLLHLVVAATTCCCKQLLL